MKSRFHLLLLPLGILLLGMGTLLLGHHLTADSVFLPWVAAIVSGAFFVQFLLDKRYPKMDSTLFPVAMLLASLGIIMIGRLKPALFLTQMRWLLLGIIVYLVIIFLGEKLLRFLSYLLSAVALLGALFRHGDRWKPQLDRFRTFRCAALGVRQDRHHHVSGSLPYRASGGSLSAEAQASLAETSRAAFHCSAPPDLGHCHLDVCRSA